VYSLGPLRDQRETSVYELPIEISTGKRHSRPGSSEPNSDVTFHLLCFWGPYVIFCRHANAKIRCRALKIANKI
jgi:hypothetical protein